MTKKRVLIGSLLILLLALTAAVFLAPPYIAKRVCDELVTRLSDKLGRPVTYAEARLSPFGALTLEGFEIAGSDKDAPPLVRIESIHVAVDPATVFSGPIDVESVLLDTPKVHVRLGADGRPELGDLPERVARLLDKKPAEGTPPATSGGGRRIARVPSIDVSGIDLLVDGPGVAPLAAFLPPVEGGLTELRLRSGALMVRNTSILAEDPILELSAAGELAPLGQRATLTARFVPGDGSLSVELKGVPPFAVVLGERRLSVASVAYAPEAGLTLRDVVLTQPGGSADRPFLRIRRVGVRLGDAPEGVPNGSPLLALLGRVARVDLDEPELYFARSGEVRAPIGDLEEQIYVDDLDARLDDQLEDLAAEAPKRRGKPGPTPAPATPAGRRVKPNGERLRLFLGESLGGLQGTFDQFSAFIHRFGSRLPVREVHVTKGRFLYEDTGAGESGFRGKLNNFYLDAERREPDQVFAFRVAFETPDSERSKNRVEGKIHLLTRDLQVSVRIAELILDRYRPLLPSSFELKPTSAIHDTNVTLTYSSEHEEVRLDGVVFLRDVQLRAPALAAEPLTDLRLGGEFGLVVEFAKHALRLDPSRFYLNDLQMAVEGEIEDYAGTPRIRVACDLARTDLARIVKSVPKALVPRLSGLRMDGSFGVHMDLSIDTADLSTLTYKLVPDAAGVRVLSMGDYVDLERIQGTFRHEVHEPDGTTTSFLVGPDAPDWVPLDQVSRYVIAAFTTTEDGNFFRHRGFSPTQIRDSIIANLDRGYFYRGASTITQQLVKNLFLTRDKTISRKLQEAFITWQIEETVTKERIFELYLNVIEWGPKIYGIRAAADHYFGKLPADLTLLETAFLVSIVPNPRRFYEQFERGEVSPRWQDRIRRIIGAMATRGKIEPEEAAAAAPYSPVFRGQGEVAPPPTPTPRPRDDDPPADDPPAPRRADAPEPPDDGIPMPDGH